MTPSRSLPGWLDYIERQHPQSIQLGLERVREVALRMDLRHPGKRVITVGGTNGKGSTVAFIEAIARAATWRVGAYTSPHLLRYNERVRIDGIDAGDEDLVSAFEAVEAARTDIQLTYFEYGTLAALWLFQQSELDLAILEVGLGGRLDAVNLIDADVAVITTVDIDHQAWLGNDRESIGFEKAGIARAGKPLILGEDDPPSSVLGHGYAIGAVTIRAGCDFFFEPIDDELMRPGFPWRWHEVGFTIDLPLPTLDGPVQLRNAATAIAALRAIDTPIEHAAYVQGVRHAQLAGRLQHFDRNDVQVVVDVAHNPQAARELAAWLEQTPINGRTLAVFAALGDKDIVGIVDSLAGRIDDWFLAGLADAGARGLHVEAFAQRLIGTDAARGAGFASVGQALAAALDQAREGDRIVVFGSFHTAATVLESMRGSG
ncbi:MAG: bifunctional tetrahydrofolate synthase/dihydrofolate synthase [Luteimonas sp.]